MIKHIILRGKVGRKEEEKKLIKTTYTVKGIHSLVDFFFSFFFHLNVVLICTQCELSSTLLTYDVDDDDDDDGDDDVDDAYNS